MKILVAGSNGQLGSELKVLHQQYPGWEFLFLDLPDIDITNQQMVGNILKSNHIDVIINCAAYTAVDKAEEEKELAAKVNAVGPGVLAKEASNNNSLFIHVSTDFIFDGKKSSPYTEEDAVNPLSEYGRTKADGEKAVIENCSKSIIVRTSWLYSSFGNNFVKTMLKLGKDRDSLNVIYEQIGTPTYANDLAKAILKIVEKSQEETLKYGIYHYSNEGVASWYDFTKAIFDLSGITCNVSPILAKDYPLPAERPTYSVMDKNKIKTEFKLDIPYWRESLKTCLTLIKQ